MRLQDCRDSYYYSSQKASDICRNLGFAGLALIWAFRVTTGPEPEIPYDLRWAGGLLVVGLVLDFLQYLSTSIIWGLFNRIKENAGTKEGDEFLAPLWINYPANVVFYLKQIAVVIAYVLILVSMRNSFWT